MRGRSDKRSNAKKVRRQLDRNLDKLERRLESIDHKRTAIPDPRHQLQIIMKSNII
jgi:hypothetical protein